MPANIGFIQLALTILKMAFTKCCGGVELKLSLIFQLMTILGCLVHIKKVNKTSFSVRHRHN